MKKTPVKGTNDYLPEDVRLRDYLQNKILETYIEAGYERISTPAIEDAENLDKSDGGDNLNLIFNIMKRGDKLARALENGDKLFDLGLRYDLTLPLSRYFANNRENLIMPAKCIQIGSVYRAERPQKGRLREFVQCDIDVIGSKSYTMEVELIYTTAKALKAIGIGGFTVRVNDRRILRLMLKNLGFGENDLDSVCITFDKLDKIGIDGVTVELEAKGFDAAVISRFGDVISRPMTLDAIGEICGGEETENLRKIIAKSESLAGGAYKIEFDISLVRGQGYYTGTVFEVVSDNFKGSVAGGGRYDNLIGKFIGEDVPAVGFSIGFERIFALLKDAGYRIPDEKKRVALLYDADDIEKAIAVSENMRGEYSVTLCEKPKKLSKYLDRIKEKNYYGFCFLGEEVRELK
ncbi:MAG: histidine--tRNA ligase [Firmicutes bacterium]|nr:histidine--tRNA ligase [Bacillota bacterium]